MKRVVVGGLVVLGLGVMPATAQTQRPDDAQIEVRRQISMMEGVLRSAVQNGVDSLRRRVRAIMPDDALIQGGLAEVRGFPLEGHGVFFDVEVPMLRQSMAWTLLQRNQAGALLSRDIEQLRRFVESLPDPAMRAQLDRAVQNIQRQVAPFPVAVAERQPAAPGAVAAQSLASTGAPAAANVATGPPVTDAQIVLDPNEAYTQEVKRALIEAMVVYGAPMNLSADQWLIVAAKDNEPANPLVQADSDFRTIMLKIMGSDLIEYKMDRLTLDEVRSRVIVQEF